MKSYSWHLGLIHIYLIIIQADISLPIALANYLLLFALENQGKRTKRQVVCKSWLPTKNIFNTPIAAFNRKLRSAFSCIY